MARKPFKQLQAEVAQPKPTFIIDPVKRGDTVDDEPVHHYEINVSKRGFHLFATHPRSMQTRDDAQRVYNLIVAAFPAPEYEVSIRAVVEYGVIFQPRRIA